MSDGKPCAESILMEFACRNVDVEDGLKHMLKNDKDLTDSQRRTLESILDSVRRNNRVALWYHEQKEKAEQS